MSPHLGFSAQPLQTYGLYAAVRPARLLAPPCPSVQPSFPFATIIMKPSVYALVLYMPPPHPPRSPQPVPPPAMQPTACARRPARSSCRATAARTRTDAPRSARTASTTSPSISVPRCESITLCAKVRAHRSLCQGASPSISVPSAVRAGAYLPHAHTGRLFTSKHLACHVRRRV